eukprot:TRINITY_DN3251_c0_g2_i1.p1 TRINITY_DN3251_c0_g2~~TRINITY_DN3251_c0_g2_i1.p1  ORF type:complete len:681 (+),score=137.24 TRINITY_DN3251_c0_g2_i1:1322-3364(+)
MHRSAARATSNTAGTAEQQAEHADRRSFPEPQVAAMDVADDRSNGAADGPDLMEVASVPPRVPDDDGDDDGGGGAHSKRRRVGDSAGLQGLERDQAAGDAEPAPACSSFLPPQERAEDVGPGTRSDAPGTSSSVDSNRAAPAGSDGPTAPDGAEADDVPSFPCDSSSWQERLRPNRPNQPPPATPTPDPTAVVFVAMLLDDPRPPTPKHEFFWNFDVNYFQQHIAEKLEVDSARILVVKVEAGSVIVQFMLLPPDEKSLDQTSATELAEALVRLVDLRSAFLRPIARIDSNVRIAVSYTPFPVDLVQEDRDKVFRPSFTSLKSSMAVPAFSDAPPPGDKVYVALELDPPKRVPGIDPAKQVTGSDLIPILGNVLELAEPGRIAVVSFRADEDETRHSVDSSSLQDSEFLGHVTIITSFWLGAGADGRVYLGWHSPPGVKSRMLALKKANADKEAGLLAEGVLMRTIRWERAQANPPASDLPPSHGIDRVLPYFGKARFNSATGSNAMDVHLCTEWMPGGCFDHRLTLKGSTYPFNLARILAVVIDVAVGMAYVHSHRIAHMDLHRGNVFLKPVRGRYVAKVADFGWAAEMANWPCDEQLNDFSSFCKLLEFAFTVGDVRRYPIASCRAEGVRELITELGAQLNAALRVPDFRESPLLQFEEIIARLKNVTLPTDDVVLND